MKVSGVLGAFQALGFNTPLKRSNRGSFIRLIAAQSYATTCVKQNKNGSLSFCGLKLNVFNWQHN